MGLVIKLSFYIKSYRHRIFRFNKLSIFRRRNPFWRPAYYPQRFSIKRTRQAFLNLYMG